MAETTPITKDEIEKVVWKACDTFRGMIDSSDYKNYILTMLFVKYVSDVWRERLDALRERYGDNEEMIRRQMQRERFQLPPDADYEHLHQNRNAENLGELIDQALDQIEEANRSKLLGVFRKISFNSDNLGEAKDRNRRLKSLLEDLSVLDLRESRVEHDVIGDAYMFLIGKFASGAGKKGGEFYTPPEVSILLGKLLDAKKGNRICDPACGSGSLLIRVAEHLSKEGHHDYSLYGQEANGSTWALCRMNMVLHDEDSAIIEWGDSLLDPKLKEDDQLRRFHIVVANPPFSLDKWGADKVSADTHKRFGRGIPPKSKGDYAFILHMVETALPKEGRVGVIVPHGVLFRGGSEGVIRKSLIEENLLDAVIGLPENLFYGTGIPAAILLFDRSRETGGANESRDDVLFIDAGKLFQPGKNQNALRLPDTDHIAKIYHDREEVERFSRKVPIDEIRDNDFNLNIPRYIDTFTAQEPVDIPKLHAEILTLEDELAKVRQRLQQHLSGLGIK